MDAFENVVRRFQREIRAWSVVNSPPGVDADEVARTNFFIAACQRIGDYEIGTNFRAWLYAIARYQLMSETKMKRIADYHRRHAPELISREFDRYAERKHRWKLSTDSPRCACAFHHLMKRGINFSHGQYDEGIPLAEDVGKIWSFDRGPQEGALHVKEETSGGIEGET